MEGLLALVRDCLRAEEPVALATVIELAPGEDPEGEALPPLGAKVVVRFDAPPMGSLGEPGLDHVVSRDTRGALEHGHSVARHYGPHGEAGRTDVTVFIEVFAPPPRMLIFGAVDFTAALGTRRQGTRVPRHGLRCPAGLCDIRPLPRSGRSGGGLAPPPSGQSGRPVGPRDAICVLTHDHKFDIPALIGALKTNVGYIGAMGSRSTHNGRVERLRAEGVEPTDIARIMAPIGIDIGSRTPEETAVSICAEIISLRAGVKADSLRDGDGPIHRVPS